MLYNKVDWRSKIVLSVPPPAGKTSALGSFVSWAGCINSQPTSLGGDVKQSVRVERNVTLSTLKKLFPKTRCGVRLWPVAKAELPTPTQTDSILHHVTVLKMDEIFAAEQSIN